MSLPRFPELTTPISRDEAVNLILTSIAMEELGLSHIINAEGEKIQYAIGTLPGMTGSDATIEEILEVNSNVRDILDGTMQNQLLLKAKMESALSASTMEGPPGPPGPEGPQG